MTVKKRNIIIGIVAASMTLTTTNLRAGDPGPKQTLLLATQPQTGQSEQPQSQPKSAVIMPKDSCCNASYLIGRDVQSSTGERVGKVQDLVLNLSSDSAPFCIVVYRGTLGIGGTRVAVPFHDLRWLADSGVLVLSASKEKFQSVPMTPTAEWATVASEDWAKNIDRFYGNPATSALSRFERQPMGETKKWAEPVRIPSELKQVTELLTQKQVAGQNSSPNSSATPVDADAKLVQGMIGLINQDAGPKGSQTIQTTLKNGVITLTGTVASEAQKQILEDHIKALPGVDRVDDQLMIK
jgi:sporulation protein YlmC with PRC-barrel domain